MSWDSAPLDISQWHHSVRELCFLRRAPKGFIGGVVLNRLPDQTNDALWRSVVDGQALIRATTLTGGLCLANHLELTEDPLGRIMVSQFGTSRLTVIVIRLNATRFPAGVKFGHYDVQTLPRLLADPGSVVIGGNCVYLEERTRMPVILPTLMWKTLLNERTLQDHSHPNPDTPCIHQLLRI